MSEKTFAWLFCNGASACLLFALCLTNHLSVCKGTTLSSEENAAYPSVTITQGTLQGYNMLTYQNRTIHAFTKVPYAQPPVGNLRFMAPVAPSPWNGTLNASGEMPLCVQKGSFSSAVGEEDCLYLHVYTPKLPTNACSALLPVMFFIVGGGFNTDVSSFDRYGPDFFLDEDVVLVIPTFRVGALGFLSTGDEVLPGNYGIKDIVRALEWTQENIEYFGGDPDQVTLFGGSSGAITVSLLTLTDATDGLFHRYITQSGAATLPMLQETRESYAKTAIKLGENFGCPTNTSTLLLDCLRDVNASELADSLSLFYEWKTFPSLTWHPTVEPDIEGALITESPATLVANGKGRVLPWLNSNVRDEGLVFALKFILNSTLLEEFLENIDVALPQVAEYAKLVSNVTAYTEALKAYYFPDLTANRTLLLNNLTLLMGDSTMWYPSYNMLQQRLSIATTSGYHCSFDYRGVFDYSYYYTGGYTNLTGVWHGDENIYLFRDRLNSYGPSSYQYSEKDLTMVKKMVKMWTSFAINGEPTPANEDGAILWEPFSSCQNYLQIGNYSDTGLTVQYGPNTERMEFWDNLAAAIPWKRG